MSEAPPPLPISTSPSSKDRSRNAGGWTIKVGEFKGAKKSDMPAKAASPGDTPPLPVRRKKVERRKAPPPPPIRRSSRPNSPIHQLRKNANRKSANHTTSTNPSSRHIASTQGSSPRRQIPTTATTPVLRLSTATEASNRLSQNSFSPKSERTTSLSIRSLGSASSAQSQIADDIDEEPLNEEDFKSSRIRSLATDDPMNISAAFSYESMVHQFPAAEQQARAGAFVLLRMGKFMKKEVEILKHSCIEKKKVTSYESGKWNECKQDRMLEHLEGMERMYEIEKEVERSEDSLKKELLAEIAEPAIKFYEEKIKILDAMSKQQRLKSTALEHAAGQLDEARKSCLKKFRELKNVHGKLQACPLSKIKEHVKLEKKKNITQETAMKQFQKTEKLERQYNDKKNNYRHIWLPESLRTLRKIEHDRLSLQKQLLEMHCKLRIDQYAALSTIFKKAQQRNTVLNAQRDLNICCESWEREYGFPPPLIARAPLPCSSEDLKSDRWETASNPKKNKADLKMIEESSKVIDSMTIVNTPIDVTTTLEEEDEEWYSAVSEHIPQRSADIGIQPGDIVHVISKNPNIRRKLSIIPRFELDPQQNTMTMKLLQKGDVVDMIIDSVQKDRTLSKKVNTATVLSCTSEDGINLCELELRTENGIIKETFMQEPKRISGKSSEFVKRATVSKDQESDESAPKDNSSEVLRVTKGETIVVLKREPPDGGLVHAISADGKEGVLPFDAVILDSKVRIGFVEIPPESRRYTLLESQWLGINLRSRMRGLFPPSTVQAVDVAVGDDKEDEEDDEEDHAEEEAKHQGSSKSNFLTEFIKKKVSKKKRRYMRDGYNLDLSYITPNIIAMGFPSTGIERKYRNDINDVQRFFKEKHRDSYKIWNLCIEKGRTYAHNIFEGNVIELGFHDHNPCPFNMIEGFCKDLDQYYASYPKGIAAIHCKAGKGRTGFLISCYFIYSDPWFTAHRALRLFAVKRTKNAKGVTIPSQRRYVYYFERYLRNREVDAGIGKKQWTASSFPKRFAPVPKTRNVKLIRVSLLPIPNVVKSDGVVFTVWSPNEHSQNPKENLWKSKGQVKCQRRPGQDYLFFSAGEKGITGLSGDAKFTFSYEGGFIAKSQKLFHFWINTRFLHPMKSKPGWFEYTLFKAELDKACKDKKHESFSDTFRVELEFFLDE